LLDLKAPIRPERGQILVTERTQHFLDRACLTVRQTGEGMIADTLPILGQSQELPGLIHAFGFSGHGFALVPLIGPLVVDIAQGRNINLPIDAFAVCRFGQYGSDQAT